MNRKQKKKFQFDLFIRIANGQEFKVASKVIESENYDMASKLLNKLDLPFCHFILVNKI